MTTERRAVLRVSPLELRLYVAALLAAVYTISWRAIGGHVPAPVTAEAPTEREPQPQPNVVWLDSVPATSRPAIAVPAGWEIAAAPAASSTPPARVMPARRVPRVRTRSS